jgi:hypothetical protein
MGVDAKKVSLLSPDPGRLVPISQLSRTAQIRARNEIGYIAQPVASRITFLSCRTSPCAQKMEKKSWYTSFHAWPSSPKGMVGLFRPKLIIVVFYLFFHVFMKRFINKLENKNLRKNVKCRMRSKWALLLSLSSPRRKRVHLGMRRFDTGPQMSSFSWPHTLSGKLCHLWQQGWIRWYTELGIQTLQVDLCMRR